MKNWKNAMAGFCAAALVGTMVMPVYAEEAAAEAAAAEETAAEGEVQDITEAMLGLWQDNAGDIYGFYSDYSFFGRWVEAEEEVLGEYALVTDGENTALSLIFDDGGEAAFLVAANEAEGKLELYDENGELTAEMMPYEGAEDDNNVIYQMMAEIIQYCEYGVTDAEEAFAFAYNEDGSYCAVMVLNENGEYASFIGAGTENEDGTITVADETSGMTLTFSVTDNGDETRTLDMGDLGSAVVASARVADAIELLMICNEYGTPVN